MFSSIKYLTNGLSCCQITSYLFKTNGVNATVRKVTFSKGSIITNYNVLTTTSVSSRTIAEGSSQAIPYVILGSVIVIAEQGWFHRSLASRLLRHRMQPSHYVCGLIAKTVKRMMQSLRIRLVIPLMHSGYRSYFETEELKANLDNVLFNSSQ
jgi:hypothetical protein